MRVVTISNATDVDRIGIPDEVLVIRDPAVAARIKAALGNYQPPVPVTYKDLDAESAFGAHLLSRLEVANLNG